MDTLWTIELLGGMAAVGRNERTSRFATQKTAALLAYLAFYSGKSHLRETLIEALWPETDPAVGRARLSTLLSYLRSLLEPPGTPAGTVVQADRTSVRLNPERLTTDVRQFEALLQKVGRSDALEEKITLLKQADALYQGDLLPGFYEEWVGREQALLREKYVDLLHALAHCLHLHGERREALPYLEKASALDPYREGLIRLQMRCYAAMSRPEAALEAYRLFQERLQEALDAPVSAATRALADRIRLQPDAFDGGEEDQIPLSVRAEPETPPQQPPAELSSTTFSSNLPLPITRFVGRARELTRLQEWLQAPASRLMTLTGPGGTGKTRLALEAAAGAAQAYAGRVWFVDLTAISHPRMFPFVLIQALNLPASRQMDPFEQAIERLKEAPSLLILDNFEHLLWDEPEPTKREKATENYGVDMVRLLLERVPRLTCLLTSRQPLRLGSEQELAVPVLSVPSRHQTLESLSACDSVSLYVDRARAVRPDFTLSAHNAETVAELCRRLEGIPLAIEMAAAWAKTVTPAKALERFGAHLDLLTSRRRDVTARHLSMHAAIEWSYDLLPTPLPEIFCRLSAFRCGWTLEDAEAVCGQSDLLDALTELSERSLICTEEQDDQMRFRFLEPIRAFAAEKLAESGEAEALRRRHFRHFLAVAEQGAKRLDGPEVQEWYQRFQAEQDNFRYALETAESGEARLRLATALWRYWYGTGRYVEARRWLERGLLECAEDETMLRAQALTGIGAMASNQGDYETARGRLEEAQTLWRLTDDGAGLSGALNNLGVLEYRMGAFSAARILLEEALTLRRALKEMLSISATLNNLAVLACDMDDFEGAERYHAENLALKRAAEDRAGVALALGNMGHVAYRQAAYARARRLLEESLAEYRLLGTQPGIAFTQFNLGAVLYDQGELEHALQSYTESLRIFREIGEKRGIAYALGQLSGIVLQQGDCLQAEQYATEAEQLCRELEDRPGLVGIWARLAEVVAEQEHLAEAGKYIQQSLAAARDLPAITAQIPVLEVSARLALKERNFARAARLHGCTAHARTELRFTRTPAGQKEYEKVLETLDAVLGTAERMRQAQVGAAWSIAEALQREGPV
ncbi:MAG: DNA-binding transcriptional activator of the family [Chthonomonadaceae bacterium]|nr:DNA-binding transcriptional activator of the family [Chthonomonadaceae bacterium]